jgi:serine/threonine protein kinase
MKQTVPRAEEIFFAAVEIEGADARSAYLDEVCGDPELRRHVERLLALDARADSFLESPASAPTLTAGPPGPPEGLGTVIGPYKLREQIGEGGMGVVFVAEQARPVRRRVALKVIKPGMDTKRVIARFEAERQALAMMDHPNIAKVHDAGTTDSGRPYFVMELVRGLPITEYCDREQLTVAARLELFVLVCRAVQHAHQKGIIHRDLKPTNILVTLHDGVPVPKVIDFGVAKATGQALTDRTVYTELAQLVGTPLYMSPEQADLSGLDIDTRSDIYSLGVLLYELLTGTTPFDSETLKKAAFDEMRRIIREQEPQKPSLRLGSLGETLTTVSGCRGADPRRLNRAVRGELDWIAMKALEKDRRRRYETANDLAADVMRYLTSNPVEACPPSASYRLRKYARRNRAALTTTAVVAAALVTGTTVSVWQAVKARKAAAEAQLRADESKEVIDYLAKDIFGATAGNAGGRSVTVGQLLDGADASVGTRFRRQPLVEAGIRLALSRTYHYHGDWKRAEAHAARAAEIRERLLGPEHPATLEAQLQQAWMLSDNGWAWPEGNNPDNPSAAEAAVRLLQPVLAAHRRVHGPVHPDTLRSELVMASAISHIGRQEEAARLATQAQQRALRALGPEHETSLWALDVEAMIAQRAGNLARAEELFRRSLAGSDRAFGTLRLPAIETLRCLAALLHERGDLDEARRVYLETIDRSRSLYGLSHGRISNPMGHLFEILRSQGDYAALRDLSQRWLREVLASPIEPDPQQRERRVIRLGGMVHNLTTLPTSIPFDTELAARAVAEAVAINGGWHGWAVLGAIQCRTGRLAEALQAFHAATQQPNWAGGSNLYWFGLAVTHARRGDLARAGECYERGRAPDTARDTWTEFADSFRAEAADLLGVKPDPGTAIPKTAPESKQPPK